MAYNEGTRAFPCATDISKARLLTLAGTGNVAHASASGKPVGVSLYAVSAGDTVSVKLINSQGTFEIEAAGAIDLGDPVYAAASGKVQALPADAGDYQRIGIAVEAATADGDIIEVLPDDHVTITTV